MNENVRNMNYMKFKIKFDYEAKINNQLSTVTDIPITKQHYIYMLS